MARSQRAGYSIRLLADVRSQELQDAVHVLRASQGRLQLATEVFGAGVFEWDMGSDRFTGENPEAYRIFGRSPEQPKMSMTDFIHDGAGLGTRVEVRLPTVLSPLPTPFGAGFGTRGPQAPRRILVADDNRDAADSLAEILRLMGHAVATAEDGLDALAKLDSFRPEVVMLDIGMPRMNGYEACRQLRQRKDCGAVVVIAVTGWGQDEDRLRSQEAGFNLHLTKPVDPAAVEALLASLPAPRTAPPA